MSIRESEISSTCPARVGPTGAWSEVHACGRPIKENGWCGRHAGKVKRREREAEQIATMQRESKARGDNAAEIADLLNALLNREVAVPGYTLASGFSGNVVISSTGAIEILKRLGVLPAA